MSSPLSDLLVDNDATVHLDVAALEIARIEHPDLEIAPFLEILDSHARELDQLTTHDMDGGEYITAANHYLFEQLGFRGNEGDYYSAENSCLDSVLLTRTGIPVSLAVVYLEISRRLGRPVHGISMPGHFLVQYDDGEFDCYIDTFSGGRFLDYDDCRRLAFQLALTDIAARPEVMDPATTWQIAVRMLQNLKGIYSRRKDYGKLAQVLDWLILAMPESRQDIEHRTRITKYLQSQ
jgi:regulator of sirC expression with transglutaminase-like and TPR domain